MDPLPENPLPDPALLAQTFKMKQAPLATGIAELLTGQQSIFNTLAGMQKQLAQTINRTRGSGVGKLYDEVHFPDNTLPSQPGQGRAPLPMLNNMLDIDVTTYLTNHGILPENIPYLVTDLRKKLAKIIGFSQKGYALPPWIIHKDLYHWYNVHKYKIYFGLMRERNGYVAVVVKKGKDDDSEVDAVGRIDEEVKGPEWEIVQADRDVDGSGYGSASVYTVDQRLRFMTRY
ncbi:hypothetical protein F5876DRAFT_70807 [Lentinula aff. lateritia]|uniref:Uncharacterized protein n=1 Tax=Lentinula aff. lateritia TaxID=2804960 RepID=A0ACC1THJ3_9AGAR|nr:hypothetical protein F5876DRAFT_70807 [Lentinula aff. lateritia]